MFEIGSENEDGSHRPDRSGWPYSVYKPAKTNSHGDMVLCHGIQCLDDAEQLLAMCNGLPRPPIMTPCQMFAWD